MAPAFPRLWNKPVADEVAQELRGEDVEELQEVEGSGGSSGSVGGGVRGVVAVLDDGQEMDRFSCDLVKVSDVWSVGRFL